jgi:hypothetical protein
MAWRFVKAASCRLQSAPRPRSCAHAPTPALPHAPAPAPGPRSCPTPPLLPHAPRCRPAGPIPGPERAPGLCVQRAGGGGRGPGVRGQQRMHMGLGSTCVCAEVSRLQHPASYTVTRRPTPRPSRRPPSPPTQGAGPAPAVLPVDPGELAAEGRRSARADLKSFAAQVLADEATLKARRTQAFIEGCTWVLCWACGGGRAFVGAQRRV